MNYEELREIYNKILNDKASIDEKKKIVSVFMSLGGMSTEWFYSILTDSLAEPSKEEIDKFIQLIQELEKSF